VVAVFLTAAVAGTGADRRRREQALLRARGASLARLTWLGAVEAIVAGLAGVLVGLAAALVVGRLAFGGGSFATDPRAVAFDLALAAVVGWSIAAVAVALPAGRDARRLTVAAATRRVRRPGRTSPVPLIGGLVLLAGAAGVYLLVRRTGYELILTPEGVPSVAVAYWTLLGPLCLWAGAALVVWWTAQAALARGRAAVERMARPVAGPLAGAVAGSLTRQRRLISSGLLLVALAGAFAVATAAFDTTYQQQAEVDARLTNGGDVTVSEPPSASVPPAFARRLAAVPGVTGVEPLQHRFAYVGADLQDLYGVRPSTIVAAGGLQDAYFTGGGAAELVGRLAARPDGILVSAETARDYQLQAGDHVTLRLRDGRTGALTPVTFQYVGVVREFPTAPRDSFLVANGDYVARATGSDAVGSFLIDAAGVPPADVAARVRAVAGPAATVSDIASTRAVVGSSLTAVDLGGLTRLELGFAAVLGAAGGGLVLALVLAERRRSLAVLVALGARRRQLGAFVGGEALVISAGGLVAGAVTGAALAELLVAVLTGVFDPAPAALAVPWGYLAAVAAVLVAASAGAVALTLAGARRSVVETLRRL
jgi:putative ABC transport system permease protein